MTLLSTVCKVSVKGRMSLKDLSVGTPNHCLPRIRSGVYNLKPVTMQCVGHTSTFHFIESDYVTISIIEVTNSIDTESTERAIKNRSIINQNMSVEPD